MYYTYVRHKELGKIRRVSGTDKQETQEKARALKFSWDEQWQRKCRAEAARAARKAAAREKLRRKAEADLRKKNKTAYAARKTAEAEDILAAFSHILTDGMRSFTPFDWDSLYRRQKFREPAPHPPGQRPRPTDAAFQPRYTLLDKLLPGRKTKREAQAAMRLQLARENWISEAQEFHLAKMAWLERKAAFDQAQADDNARVDAFKALYARAAPRAVSAYTDWVLGFSAYPPEFPKRRKIVLEEGGALVLDYALPLPEDMPATKAVRYVEKRDAFEEVALSRAARAALYEDALYQTCLRTLYEVFRADDVRAIKSAVFNGFVRYTDKASGQPGRACILSLRVRREAFDGLQLQHVDAKACFRALGGVSGGRLAAMVPVVPEERLPGQTIPTVPARDVLSRITADTNIAALSWEEFEYLVRDIFEKEFADRHAEVQITQASHDHGVDAIALDPDPIRGGKTVIQAKRYTHVVSVTAVRDLYGTVINEGANRGIIVTTSHFGPDSYAFAKDKPLSLMDGDSLLALMAKHGHPARIAS